MLGVVDISMLGIGITLKHPLPSLSSRVAESLWMFRQSPA